MKKQSTKRSVGRPRQFDEAVVLGQVLDVFWEKGYEATSVEDIVSATGLKKASLYSTFGNKQALFVKSCRLYRETFEPSCTQALKPGGGLDAIKHFLYSEIDMLTADVKKRGCLMINTIVGDHLHDPAIAIEWQAFLKNLELGFLRAMVLAEPESNAKSDPSPASVARYFVTLTQGIMVAVKAGAGSKQLREVARIALRGVGWDK